MSPFCDGTIDCRFVQADRVLGPDMSKGCGSVAHICSSERFLRIESNDFRLGLFSVCGVSGINRANRKTTVEPVEPFLDSIKFAPVCRAIGRDELHATTSDNYRIDLAIETA